MTNELGNHLYKLTIKQVQALCHSKYTKMLADYVVDNAVKTTIYNISDVISVLGKTNTNLRVGENLPLWVHTISGIPISDKDDNLIDFYTEYTPFVDHYFAYGIADNGLQYVLLSHRIDDTRAAIFFGFVEDNNFTVFQCIPLTIIDNIVRVDLTRLLEAADMFSKNIRYVRNSREVMKTLFVGYLSCLFAMFRDITNQDKKMFKCFVDEAEQPKMSYYRKRSNKEVIKVQDKPIILILRDEGDINHKIITHKSSSGRIHYAFSWVVRGHYRRLHNPESIGRDRNGERCIQGMTWIDTYLKGDENLPLLKRETIVIDKRKKIC